MNEIINFTQEIEDLKSRMLQEITRNVKNLHKALYFPSENNKIGEYNCDYISLDSDGVTVNVNVISPFGETTEMQLIESPLYTVDSMHRLLHLLSWYGDEDRMVEDYIKAHTNNDVDINDIYERLSELSFPDFVMRHKEMLYRTPDGEVESYDNIMYAFEVEKKRIYNKFSTVDSDSEYAFVDWMLYNNYSLFGKDVDIDVRITQFKYAYVLTDEQLEIEDLAIKEFLFKRGLTLDDVKYLNVGRIVAEFNESHYVTENGYLFKIL